MYVPEPVISLSLKAKGTETPNFSRALNRFKREDPTFRVHVDHESKEVVLSSHLLLYSYDSHSERRLSLVWANYTWRSTLNECDGNTIRTVLLESPGLPSERPSRDVPIFHLHIKSKQEVQANLPKL